MFLYTVTPTRGDNRERRRLALAAGIPGHRPRRRRDDAAPATFPAPLHIAPEVPTPKGDNRPARQEALRRAKPYRGPTQRNDDAKPATMPAWWVL